MQGCSQDKMAEAIRSPKIGICLPCQTFMRHRNSNSFNYMRDEGEKFQRSQFEQFTVTCYIKTHVIMRDIAVALHLKQEVL